MLLRDGTRSYKMVKVAHAVVVSSGGVEKISCLRR
jgi:hypothetical protein